MLKTEQNTRAMGKRVATAARKYFRKRIVHTIFEHGQWWIELADGSQYSVADAEGGDSIDGFDFEQVTAPTED